VNGFGTQRPKRRYRFQIDFQCDPARLDELTQQVFAVIKAVQETGIDADEVQQIQEIQRRQHEVGVRTNSFWIEGILDRDTNGMDLRDLTQRIKLVDHLTDDQIRNAARTYLHTSRYVRVAMLPEDAAGP
jgi:zinc protease